MNHRMKPGDCVVLSYDQLNYILEIDNDRLDQNAYTSFSTSHSYWQNHRLNKNFFSIKPEGRISWSWQLNKYCSVFVSRSKSDQKAHFMKCGDVRPPNLGTTSFGYIISDTRFEYAVNNWDVIDKTKTQSLFAQSKLKAKQRLLYTERLRDCPFLSFYLN